MEMEKTYYVVTPRPAYLSLLRSQAARPAGDTQPDSDIELPHKMIVAITQGGFGQDVVDDERQTKERYLEHLFEAGGLDLPRSSEVFDQYFTLEAAEEFIDLDDEY